MDVTKEVLELDEELVQLRRDFHRHPELGFEEFRTSDRVCHYLAQCGLGVKRVAQTGVVGLLRGGSPGRTLILRADMDALPIQEETGLPYRSIYEGKMHACGHDGHMAMLLVAAKILSRHGDRLRGHVKFVFEPNEEHAGAAAMIEEGVLEDPPVDACLGVHLWTPIQTGEMAVSTGPIMAGMDHFQLTLKGKGGHTAAPHLSVDPIIAAADMIQRVQVIQTREIDALKPTLIMFGMIRGGTASNVIPERVELAGTIRYLYEAGDASGENPRGRFEGMVAHLCRANRVDYELAFPYGHPALINDPTMTELVRSTAEEVLGERQRIVSFASMAGEDFSEFAARVPGAFYFIGAGRDEKSSRFPHHHPRFDIDEDALKTGVEMHVRTALKYLST